MMKEQESHSSEEPRPLDNTDAAFRTREALCAIPAVWWHEMHPFA